MIHAKITSKGQITLPVEMREKLALMTGDQVIFEQLDNGDFVLRKKTRDIRELRGTLKSPAGKPVSLKDMDRDVGEYLGRKHGIAGS